MTESHSWWQKGILYQVYVRSFCDASGDGVGDLAGIRQKLDYLQWLGVDAIWLTPFYPSPMADFGYDVANYTDVDPLFGSLEQLDQLIAEAHARNLKVIIDFVPNHTSDKHPWFVESRSSKDNPKRDWYIWQDPVDGGPRNNWLSAFGGSAWEYDEATGQYYYHAFLKEQPDLNWRNPQVRAAMYSAMRFWLDRGVDGFRVDVLWHLIKDAQFRDNPVNPDYVQGDIPYNSLVPAYSTDQPEVHEIVREMRQLVDSYPNRVMIGEIYLPIRRLVAYYGDAQDGAHLPFNFQLITLPWSAVQIGAAISEYEGALLAWAWPNWVLGNHDQARIASRVGLPQARVACLLLLTLRGTPTMYYGDEIGMRDAPLSPEQYQDPQGKNVGVSRDPQRTPMQWAAAEYAGFSQVPPWLPVSPDYAQRNVEKERHDPESILNLYRRLIELRRNSPALCVGSYTPLVTQGQLLAYLREAGNERFLVVLNLGHGPQQFRLDNFGEAEVVVSTDTAREGQRVKDVLRMVGDDGFVLRLKPKQD
ncbi:MAG TPA: alpha-amylase family glycosyl hydrolase [Polyangiaceae bacterium]|nr:alpha-amylase family glycosyl hydrolase [Polyangiaceae bacterium]